MTKLTLLAAGALLCGLSLGAALPAKASVVVDPHLSGTGDNVIADSVSTNSALGHLNGTHLDVVRYTGLSNGFTGASSGNDIKIDNTTGLTIEVFDPTNTFEINTFTQVFSLKGTGTVGLTVVANDGTFTFNLGTINGSQSGFTVATLNSESIVSLTLLDVGGTITDFEHNRIDTAFSAASPLPASLPLFAAGLLGLAGLTRSLRKQCLGA
jgi:hypothetical protein